MALGDLATPGSMNENKQAALQETGSVSESRSVALMEEQAHQPLGPKQGSEPPRPPANSHTPTGARPSRRLRVCYCCGSQLFSAACPGCTRWPRGTLTQRYSMPQHHSVHTPPPNPTPKKPSRAPFSRQACATPI